MFGVMSGAAASSDQLPVGAQDHAFGVGEAASVVAPTVVLILAIPAELCVAGGNSMWVASKAHRAGIALVLGRRG